MERVAQYRLLNPLIRILRPPAYTPSVNISRNVSRIITTDQNETSGTFSRKTPTLPAKNTAKRTETIRVIIANRAANRMPLVTA